MYCVLLPRKMFCRFIGKSLKRQILSSNEKKSLNVTEGVANQSTNDE